MGLLFHSTKFSCYECEKHFPRSILITIHGHQYCTQCSLDVNKETTYCESCGVETAATKLCRNCNRVKNESAMYFCDGCGNDYPRTHLIYSYRFDGHFCDQCHAPEEGDEE